ERARRPSGLRRRRARAAPARRQYQHSPRQLVPCLFSPYPPAGRCDGRDVMVAKPLSTEAALDARLSALAGCWLELRCPCNPGTVLYPVDLLRRRHGDRPLRTILPRFRCQRCGGPPSPVYLCETPPACVRPRAAAGLVGRAARAAFT